MTTGILLKQLCGNPNLDGVDVVILDEVHERGLDTDFSLLVLRDLVRKRKALSRKCWEVDRTGKPYTELTL